MRKFLTQIAMTLFLTLVILQILGAVAFGQVVGLQPTPIGIYTWNPSTNQWDASTNPSTANPFPTTPQAYAFYGWNATLGQWTPCTSMADCGFGSSVTWPTSGGLVLSNETNAPAGLAPVDGDCAVGAAGAWTVGSCGTPLALATNGTPNISQGTLNFSNTTPAAPSGYTNVLWQNSGGNESAYVPTAAGGGVTTFGNDYSLVGAFTDSSGNVLKAISISTTSQVTFSAPVGTTQLQLGVSDDVMGDNTGSWTVAVNGTNYTVLGTATPWTNAGGINSQFPIGTSGSTAATVIPVANVNLPVTIQYVSGTVASSSHSQCGTVHAITVDASGVAGCVVTFGNLVSPFYLPTYWTVSAPVASGSTSLAEGAPAVGDSSNQVSASPYQLYPHVLDTGSGTEASPWMNATDNTAGIQTQLNALVAGRGGEVDLAPGRFQIKTPITLTGNSTRLYGIGQGYNAQPNGDAEGTWGEKLRVDSSLTTGIPGAVQMGVVGGSYSNRTNGLMLDNLYMWGTTATPAATLTNNAGVYFNGWNDQTHVHRLGVSNFGVGVYGQSATGDTDDGVFDEMNITADGWGMRFDLTSTNQGCWGCRIFNNSFSDNTWPNFAAFGNGGTANGNNAPGDWMSVYGNVFSRGCTSSGCAALTGGENANVYSERGYFNFFGNNSNAAGYTNGGAYVTANGVSLNGPDQNAGGNVVVGQNQTGECGFYVGASGARDYIHGNVLHDNTTDICIASGAADTRIQQPGATITDSGTRTVINNISTNAGDPNTAGAWNGIVKWAGLIIYDTTNDIQYLYLDPSTRIQLNGGGGVTWPTTGDVVVSNGTSTPAGVAPVNGDCIIGSGGAWIAGSCSGSGSTYPLSGFTAPNITGWTWSNQGSATATVNNGVLFIGNTGNGADNIHLIGTTLPATPWTVIAALIPSQGPGFPTYQTQWSNGLALTDGTKITYFNVGVGTTAALANSVGVANYTNATTFSANVYSGTPAQFPLVLWERIQDNGTTRTYSFSSDPTNLGWKQVYSEAHAGFLTPTKVGIAANYFANSNTFTGYPWVSWNVTTP